MKALVSKVVFEHKKKFGIFLFGRKKEPVCSFSEDSVCLVSKRKRVLVSSVLDARNFLVLCSTSMNLIKQT